MRWLKDQRGVWVYKAADNYTAGIPDIVGCKDGRFFGIELKVGKNKPSKIQRFVMDRIEQAGGICQVCRSLDEVKNFIGKEVTEYA